MRITYWNVTCLCLKFAYAMCSHFPPQHALRVKEFILQLDNYFSNVFFLFYVEPIWCKTYPGYSKYEKECRTRTKIQMDFAH